MAAKFIETVKSWFTPKHKSYNGGTLGTLDSQAFRTWFLGTTGGDIGYNNLTFPIVARDAFEKNCVTYKCVMSIASGIADLKYDLFNKTTNKKITSHPVLDLWNRPNPMQSQSSFIMHCVADLLLDGNMFIEKIGPNKNVPVGKRNLPRRLWPLQPDWVQIATGEKRIPGSYTYTAGGVEGGESKTFPVDPVNATSDCLHIKSYAPLREAMMGRGLSPVRSAWSQILTHNEGTRWNYHMLKFNATPAGVLQAETNLSLDQVAFLKTEFAENYQGSRNAGKPLLLDGGLKWTAMSLSPVDMAYLEGKNSCARDIALALGVPPILLHIPGDTTYNNMIEAKQAFYEETILPRAQHFLDEINRWLVADFDPNLELRIDIGSITALIPRLTDKWNRLNSSIFITTNERRELAGLDPVDDPVADQVLVPSKLVPLEKAGTVLPAMGTSAGSGNNSTDSEGNDEEDNEKNTDNDEGDEDGESQ